MFRRELSGFEELSLKKVRIQGDMMGKFGTFTIEQIFVNSRKKALEVNYTFPITETAIVTGFTVKVGEKEMRGVCKEKGEARKEYVDNISRGNSAYMLEQDTANVFNVMVGRVLSNEEVKITISYLEVLSVVGNKMRLIIPTLVNQRYKSVITDSLKYGKVDYTVDFDIKLNKVLEFSSIESVNHKIDKKEVENAIEITAKNYDMSKDFVLNMNFRNTLVSNACYSQSKDGNKIMLLNFMPEINENDNKPKEYIFVVDVSGSMSSSNKIGKTKEALKRCLKELKEGDKFNILPFESEYTFYNIESVNANDKNISKAIEFIDELQASGGTEILDPIKFSLYERSDDKIVIVLTDGEVGNEDEITNFISKNIYNSRLFALGIDTSVNTAFIKGMAKAGNGKPEFIYPDEDMEEAIVRTFARIQSPLVREVKIDYGKNKMIGEIKEDSNLFNHEFFQAIVQIEDIVDDIVLKGKVGEKEFSWKINKEDIVKAGSNLELLYVKKQMEIFDEQVKSYEYDYRNKNARALAEEFKNRIVKLSCEYNIASKYTSFITVNEREEKVFESMDFENITLSNMELGNACFGAASVNPRRSFMKACSSGKMWEEKYVLDDSARDRFAVPCDDYSIEEELEKEIKKNWKSYDIMTFLLAITFLHETDSELPFESMFKEFIGSYKGDLSLDCVQKMLYYMYSKYILKEYILDGMLTGVYRKLVVTRASCKMDLDEIYYEQKDIEMNDDIVNRLIGYLEEEDCE